MTRPSDNLDAWWSVPAADLLQRLASRSTGLTATEARVRLQGDAANHQQEDTDTSALRLLLRQVSSPMVLILLFGAAISLVLQDWTNAAIILVIVIGSLLLGFSQEYRASTAVARLRRRLALQARVMRDGALTTVPARSVVSGDIVRLSAGNLVPADGIVIEATDFLVTEASLTGEPFPVEKRPGILPAATPIAERSNCVHAGTSVRSGTAQLLVVATGRRTALGAISVSLRKDAPETEFTRGVRRFGYLLLRIMLLTVVAVLLVNQWLHRAPIESLLFAVALAVGLSPELLPAIVSVTLSHGARAMARRGVIVRHPEAIENLGSMDILCTDKTGTLTEGVIALDDAVDCEGRSAIEVRQLAYLNAAFETGIDNPLDAAIVAAGRKQGLDSKGFSKVDEIPYDFIRKRLTIVLASDDTPGEHLIVMKGAFASVLDVCSFVQGKPLDDTVRARLDAYYESKGREGYRVLAVASKRVAPKTDYVREDESGMSLDGFLLFFDPVKPHAMRAMNDLAALGVRIKIITGDNRHVAGHVAESLGLGGSEVLTGADIDHLNDESLWQRATRINLFAEVDPQQKERIVRALQHAGHVVGYLGDGINDGPSLHVADVGISVDKAVDVAREAAAIVLLRPDLDVLRRGVEEGRRTFANTLKYVCVTTSANFGNMMSMAVATTLLPFLPLSAKQILLNNFLSDIPSIAISTDRVDRMHIERAQRWDLRDVQRFMVVFGLISSAFDLITFAMLHSVFRADQATFQTTWFVVSLLTELAVVLVLRTRQPALRSRPGTLLLSATILVAVAAASIPFIPPLADAFDFVPLSMPLAAFALAVVLAYVVCTELAKSRFFNGSGKHHPTRSRA